MPMLTKDIIAALGLSLQVMKTHPRPDCVEFEWTGLSALGQANTLSIIEDHADGHLDRLVVGVALDGDDQGKVDESLALVAKAVLAVGGVGVTADAVEGWLATNLLAPAAAHRFGRTWVTTTYLIEAHKPSMLIVRLAAQPVGETRDLSPELAATVTRLLPAGQLRPFPLVRAKVNAYRVAVRLAGLDDLAAVRTKTTAMLAAEQATALPFRIAGQVKDRGDGVIQLWGTAVPVDFANHQNAAGAMIQDGNILVGHPDPQQNLAVGGYYLGPGYFVERRVGQNGFGAQVPVFAFDTNPPERARALAIELKCLDGRLAEVQGELDGWSSAAKVRIVPVVAEVNEVAAAARVLGAPAPLTTVATRRDLEDGVAGMLRHRHDDRSRAAGLVPLAAALHVRLDALIPDAVGLAEPQSLLTEAQGRLVLADRDIAGAAAQGEGDADLAYHQDLLSRLPPTVGTPEELAKLGAELTRERGAHAAAWTASPVVPGYDRWMEALQDAVGAAPEVRGASPARAAEILAAVRQLDPQGAAAGRYRRLVASLEDGIGEAERRVAGPPPLTAVNAWTATRPLDLPEAARRHHIDLLNRFAANVTGADIVAMGRAVADDRSRAAALWPDAGRLVALYAELQARQFDVYRRSPALLAAYQPVDGAFVTATVQGARAMGPFDRAAQALDAQTVRVMNDLIEGAALSPAALPGRPPLWQRAAFAQAVAAKDGSASPIWVGSWILVAGAGFTGETAAYHRGFLARLIATKSLPAVADLAKRIADGSARAPEMWVDHAAVFKLYGRAQVGMAETYVRTFGTCALAAVAAYDGREPNTNASARQRWEVAAGAIPATDAAAMAALLSGAAALDRQAVAAWCASWPDENQISPRVAQAAFWAAIASTPRR